MRYFTLIVFVFIAMIVSCNDSEVTEENQVPENLVLEIDIAEDQSGLVTIKATADNAVSYRFDMDDPGRDIETNNTGEITYEYARSGTYDIEVRAIGFSGEFITETARLEIEVLVAPIDIEKGYSTPISYDDYNLIWNDEFEGDALDESSWNYEIGTGNGGWGNNELQYYREENTSVDGGLLTITAKSENFSGSSYTSSRLTTQNKVDFVYGRVDIRAKMPEGQGVWPALWMLGANFSTVGWPQSGEIDIMEMIGGGPGKDDTTHGTLHWDNNGSKADFGGSTTLAEGILGDQFRVYTLLWDNTKIQWLLDDQVFHTTDITPAGLSEFQKEFFFIFNVAVGGNWPGSPDATTSFPQSMAVDYVRVFQRK